MTEATDTPEERFAEYGRLFAHALVARDRVGSVVVFTLAAKPGVRDWLVDLLRREAACCPFFSFKVENRGEEIVWTTSTDAGPAAEVMLDELFAGPEHFAISGWSSSALRRSTFDSCEQPPHRDDVPAGADDDQPVGATGPARECRPRLGAQE